MELVLPFNRVRLRSAHAMEQGDRREIIRPRGRYEGPMLPLHDA